MACGAPCIATRVGAFEELIKDGETGTLIEPSNAHEMFVAADALISDPIKLADWSQNARAHMELNFRLQKEADALIAVYRQLLSN